MGYDRHGPYWFRYVPDEEVRPAVRRAAEEMLAVVKRDLRLRRLTIRWFRLEKSVVPQDFLLNDSNIYLVLNMNAPRTLRGRFHPLVRPPILWVRATLDSLSAAEVVAHEARHAWQQRRGWVAQNWAEWVARERALDRDAEEYEMKMVPFAVEIVDKVAKPRRTGASA